MYFRGWNEQKLQIYWRFKVDWKEMNGDVGRGSVVSTKVV